MDNSSLSASDVALLSGNDGFGGGNGWSGMIWLFAILALMGGGFGGFGGNQQYATRDQVQNGFDTQNMQMQTAGILEAVNAGTAQSVAATNQTFHDSLMANQNLYNEVARDMSNLQLGQANMAAAQQNCCCEIKQQIMQSNYDGAMRDAATNANFTAQIQSVKDMIQQNTIQGLRDQVDALRDQVNLSGVLRFPNTWTYQAGNFPPISGTVFGA